ncbi:MAG: hypothetical protein PUA93_01260 [Eubacteriales bacterium]|nr:hypothetical protein [Eubacteriales bacterium]
MRKAKIIFSLLSGSLVIGLSSGLLASYYQTQGEGSCIIKNAEGEEIQNEVNLTGEGEVLFPDEEKSYTIELDFSSDQEVDCSLYFTDFNEEAGSLLTVRVTKDDYQSEEEEIGKLTEESPLKFSSYLDEEHKTFRLTYKVTSDLGGISYLDASFCCHLAVRKGKSG